MPLHRSVLHKLLLTSHRLHLTCLVSGFGDSLLLQRCRCLSSPPLTHPNARGSDELMYSGENAWPMRDGSCRQSSFFSPRWTIWRGFPGEQSCKIKQSVRYNSIQQDPHIGSPRLPLLSPYSCSLGCTPNRMKEQKPLPWVLVFRGTPRLSYDQIIGAQ